MKELKDLKNLRNTIIKNLNKIGIKSVEDLRKAGATGVYQTITSKYPDKTWPICYYHYSIEVALQDKHWNDIGDDKKNKLLTAVRKD